MHAYFQRSGKTQPDGRTFDERTLQAVNLTAANVSSYREFVAALSLAKAGSIITVTESISVPTGFDIVVPNLTIQCVGRGAITPSEPNLTLFTFNDVDDCSLIDVVVNEGDGIEFNIFADYKVAYAPPAPFYKNILIKGCDICSTNFFICSDTAGVKEFTYDSMDFQFVYNWAHSKTFIHNNVHRSIVTATVPTGQVSPTLLKGGVRFIEGAMYNASVLGNTSEGYIFGSFSNVCFSGNGIYGALDFGGAFGIPAGLYSIFLDTSGTENIVTGNLYGWLLQVGPTSINANNLAVA